jgi:signal transduction histidine kinase
VNQVVLNSPINAARNRRRRAGSADAKGLITVSTHRIDDWVRFASKTPTGVPEKAQGRIFDPFFTPRRRRGTGQGLALAHAVIVKKHRGHIWFETTIGRGTTFFVRLPLVAEAERPATE